jgi:hypothetical protein
MLLIASSLLPRRRVVLEVVLHWVTVRPWRVDPSVLRGSCFSDGGVWV